MRRIEAELAASHADHRSALSARLPTLGVNGNGSVSHAGILHGTGIQGFSEVASGALYLRWAALDPEVWRRARVTHAALREARRKLEASLLDVRAEAVEAAYEVKRTRALLEQAVQTTTAARAARDAQNERYRMGVASLLELLDVEAVEQSARRQRIEAERNHRVAQVRLLAASGELEELSR